jgi:hypothetical protein
MTYVAGSLTINGGVLRITAVNQLNTVYGNSITETVTTSGLASGDEIQSVTYTYRGTGVTSYGPSETAPTQVGTYSLTPSNANFTVSGAQSKYSSITYQIGFISITKATLQLIPDTVTVVYGSPLPALVDPHLITHLQQEI